MSAQGAQFPPPDRPEWWPTSEQVQKYIRVAVYYFSGWATAKGWDSSLILLCTGIATFGLNLVWTVLSGTLIAKLNELAKYKKVEAIVVSDPSLATTAVTPSPKITT